MDELHDKTSRRYNRFRLVGSNTKPEQLVRRFLFDRGLHYHLHVKDLPGKPDIVFPKYKTVVFVNGCFFC